MQIIQAKQRIEQYLVNLLPTGSAEPTLGAAMHYAVLNGGKRLRPALVYATGVALGMPPEKLDATAASVELIHCYSLVHDDLPAMDNDHLRRGMPTCHIKFNESTAILTGDALQSLAFQVLSDPELNLVSDQQKIKMVNCLAKAIGDSGMVLGQALDMEAEDKIISSEQLSNIHDNKTGKLFCACVELGYYASGRDNPEILKNLLSFASNLGLAFQIQDDILDITSTDEKLGKPAGSDQKLGKSTYCSILGLENAKSQAQAILANVKQSLSLIPNNAPLQLITDYMIARKN